MFDLLLSIRRSLRNASLTLTVLAGLLVLAAAPLYLAALADVGLGAALADALLSQRGIRASVYPTAASKPRMCNAAG